MDYCGNQSGEHTSVFSTEKCIGTNEAEKKCIFDVKTSNLETAKDKNVESNEEKSLIEITDQTQEICDKDAVEIIENETQKSDDKLPMAAYKKEETDITKDDLEIVDDISQETNGKKTDVNIKEDKRQGIDVKKDSIIEMTEENAGTKVSTVEIFEDKIETNDEINDLNIKNADEINIVVDMTEDNTKEINANKDKIVEIAKGNVQATIGEKDDIVEMIVDNTEMMNANIEIMNDETEVAYETKNNIEMDKDKIQETNEKENDTVDIREDAVELKDDTVQLAEIRLEQNCGPKDSFHNLKVIKETFEKNAEKLETSCKEEEFRKKISSDELKSSTILKIDEDISSGCAISLQKDKIPSILDQIDDNDDPGVDNGQFEQIPTNNNDKNIAIDIEKLNKTSNMETNEDEDPQDILMPIGVRQDDEEMDVDDEQFDDQQECSVIEVFDDDVVMSTIDEKNIQNDSKNDNKLNEAALKTDNDVDDDNVLYPSDAKLSSLNIKQIETEDVEKSNRKNQAITGNNEIEEETNLTENDFIYFGKECINFECNHKGNNFIRAPYFVLNFYKIPRKSNKPQFVCEYCYDKAVSKYEELCGSLCDLQPLLLQNIPSRQDFVEILDSSEDEDDETKRKGNESELDAESINLLQSELDNTIRMILKRVEIEKQLSWTKSILRNKIKKIQEESEIISENLNILQKKADNMHNSLYQCPKIEIKELKAMDLNTGRPFISEADLKLPPCGEVKLPPIQVNSLYYAAKNKAIASWLLCRVIEHMNVVITGHKTVKYYKIQFIGMANQTIKCVSPKHMAYVDPPPIKLHIGSRVIALFDGSTLSSSKDKKITPTPNAFYPGIIAEQLQSYNKFRYLIFFDDGYAQYVQHHNVRLVCEVSEKVWEDIHIASKEFICNYLTQYQKHRPMVQVKKGQNMITESCGKWLYAKVVDIDASLVQMYFDTKDYYEWIYRGSTRLGPLFKEKQINKNNPNFQQATRRTEPYIRYMQDEESAIFKHNLNSAEKQIARSVARKSTARNDNQQTSQPVKHLNNSTIFLEDDNRPKGKVVYYTTKKNLPPRIFFPHDCHPKCLFPITHDLSSYSPLAKPLLSGWERQIFKSKLKKVVVYRAPCGRRLRSIEEIHRYLRQTKNSLNVDNFDFDCLIHCLAEYIIETSIVQKADISDGQEHMIIPCINYFDHTMPPECTYSTKRIPTDGVNLNLDREFLVGCDCTDDCSDKSKCSCWQLTLAGARFGNPNTPPENVGYSYKRLPEPVPTGIYECNSNCKCAKNCLNRVVQEPLQMKLQVFKTCNRGWGLRCLNDVPKGSFICIYAGHLLTEQNANEGGANSGDEYFAELDYIEVVERLKEGYESDVPDDNDSEDDIEEPTGENDSDEDFRSSATINKNASINTRLRARRSTKDFTDSKKSSENEDECSANDKSGSIRKQGNNDDSDNDDVESYKISQYQERQVLSFEPNISLENEESANTKYRSIRKTFGKNEFCYIMDAKKTGNVGRYFNHSCSPNLFVQNVFVDTHDLRFPWVAFFALSHIRSGTELTWNYNYEVGIVPGKVLYCQCGAPNCRGRLL